MCYQILEVDSSCRCVYYKHAVDRCPEFDKAGHGVTERTILVGHSCADHSTWYEQSISQPSQQEEAYFLLAFLDRFTEHSLDQDSQNLTTLDSTSARPINDSGNILELNGQASLYGNLSTGDDEFRLLEIQPAEDCTATVVTRLFKASLETHPPYEAVSYRWETSKEAQCIIVNGIKLPVMENVFSMLSEFRRQSPTSPRTFWIDSVCINQKSIGDRSKQVKLMGRIYSEASVVRIWLGNESDQADQAFDLIRDCGAASRRSEELVASNIIGNETGTRAITQLLKRDYWNRMWVFQEIILAKEAVVHCGKLRAPWTAFKGLDLISSKHVLWLGAQIEHSWIIEFRKALFRIAHLCIGPNQARHIHNVIHPTRHLQCQDPRDKLYALHGVCEALSGIVKVDYHIPVRDLFTTFAKQQILRENNLSTLLTAGAWNALNGDEIDLPSWVPDLRGMSGVDIRFLAGHHVNAFNARGDALSLHKAIHPAVFYRYEKDGPSILRIHATVVGSVKRRHSLVGITHSETARKRLINNFCLLADNSKLSSPKLHRLFQSLIFGDKSTLLYQSPSEERVQERATRLILGFFEDLRELFGSELVPTDFLGGLQRCFAETERPRPPEKDMRLCTPDQMSLNRREYLMRVEETTDRHEAVMFSAADGHLGIGPCNLQQDDIIVIARRCQVPLALYQSGKYHRLVAPVYVSGIMQGEFVRCHEEVGSLTVEQIHLV